MLTRNGFLGQVRLGNAPGAADYFPEASTPTGDWKSLQADTKTPFQDQITAKKPDGVEPPEAGCIYIGAEAPEIFNSETTKIAKAAEAQGWTIKRTKRGFEYDVWACKAAGPSPCPPNAKCMQPVPYTEPPPTGIPPVTMQTEVPILPAAPPPETGSKLLPVVGAAAVVGVLALAIGALK